MWRRILLLILGAFGSIIAAVAIDSRLRPDVYNESLWGHAHCIKQAYFFLASYADADDGRFPCHQGGGPSALLLLPDDGVWYPFTGAGFDESVFADARRAGVPPGKFGRVYVQGLTRKSDSRLAILFDERPTPGGDHCHFPHRLWAAQGREVLLVDGSELFIPETEWPEFARRQVEFLSKEGIAKREAERQYGLLPQ